MFNNVNLELEIYHSTSGQFHTIAVSNEAWDGIQFFAWFSFMD